MTSPAKVLFILGWGRSGSTILDNLLGEAGGFFSGGEIRYLWERGYIKNWSCGCGRAVRECPLWGEVVRRLGEADKAPDPVEVVTWQRELARVRHTWSLLRRRSDTLPSGTSLSHYTSLLADLYAALRDVTGSRVIIDSSKRPSDAALLSIVEGVEPFVLHLVRDPRAVAFSWRKLGSGVGQHAPARSTANWVTWNLAGNAVRRRLGREHSMLVRYEDFCSDPWGTLVRIVRLVGEDPAALPSLSGREVELHENHTVSGNPSRFRTGAVAIRRDDRWITDLSRRDMLLTSALAAPLMRTYRYPVLGRTAS